MSVFPLGLFDCNETKNQEVMQLLKILTEKYVPIDCDEVIDEVFFGGLLVKFSMQFKYREKNAVSPIHV